MFQLQFGTARPRKEEISCFRDSMTNYPFQVFNTGIISAKIMFTEPTVVFWVEDANTQTELGSMLLQTLSASHKRAIINQTDITFNITDQAAFGRFSGQLITSQSFTWRLESHNLHVRALKLPTSKGLTFDKKITLDGLLLLQHLKPN